MVLQHHTVAQKIRGNVNTHSYRKRNRSIFMQHFALKFDYLQPYTYNLNSLIRLMKYCCLGYICSLLLLLYFVVILLLNQPLFQEEFAISQEALHPIFSTLNAFVYKWIIIELFSEQLLKKQQVKLSIAYMAFQQDCLII